MIFDTVRAWFGIEIRFLVLLSFKIRQAIMMQADQAQS